MATKRRAIMPALDPRTKLALSMMGAMVVITATTLPAMAAVCAGLGVWMLAAAAHKQYLRWLFLVLPMALFFGLVTAFSFNIAAGILACLKLLALTTVGYLFFISTPPEDLANSLIKAGLPYPAAFVMSAGLQFVPVLGRKARDVLDAQKARGIPMKLGWSLIRRFPAFLIPLLIQTFQLAEELAEAMEGRGFGRPGRSFYKNFNLIGLDYLAMAAGGVLTALICWRLW